MKDMNAKNRRARRWIPLALLALGYIWFFILERVVIVPAHIMYTKLDDAIPFVPAFIIPYVIWYFYLLLPGLVLFFKEEDEFARYGWFVSASLLISCFIYTVWPNGIELRPDLAGEPGIFSAIINRLYLVDTPTNSAPSLHVAHSVGAHTAISRLTRKMRWPRWVSLFSLVLCALIILSTVLIKQHSVIDLVAGLVLGLSLSIAIYGKCAIREYRAAKAAVSAQ